MANNVKERLLFPRAPEPRGERVIRGWMGKKGAQETRKDERRRGKVDILVCCRNVKRR
jgi:hypothetical protein